MMEVSGLKVFPLLKAPPDWKAIHHMMGASDLKAARIRRKSC